MYIYCDTGLIIHTGFWCIFTHAENLEIFWKILDFFFQILLHLNRLKLTGRYRWFSNMCWPFGFFEDRGWLFLLSIFIGIFYYQIFLPSFPHWFLNQIKNAYLIIFFLNIELLVLHCNICNTWRVPLYQPENWRFIFYTSWLKTL